MPALVMVKGIWIHPFASDADEYRDAIRKLEGRTISFHPRSAPSSTLSVVNVRCTTDSGSMVLLPMYGQEALYPARTAVLVFIFALFVVLFALPQRAFPVFLITPVPYNQQEASLRSSTLS